jgi:hypothetical protein
MPEFAKLAEKGDAVYFGLEGDPCFPKMYRGQENRRPEWILESKKHDGDGFYLTFRNGDVTKVVSSHTIKPDEVFEFTDNAFRGVMQRETEKHKPAKTYRNTESTEIASLKTEFNKFRNAMITAVGEITKDIDDIVKQSGGKYRGESREIFSSKYQDNPSEPVSRGNMFSDDECVDSDLE